MTLTRGVQKLLTVFFIFAVLAAEALKTAVLIGLELRPRVAAAAPERGRGDRRGGDPGETPDCFFHVQSSFFASFAAAGNIPGGTVHSLPQKWQ